MPTKAIYEFVKKGKDFKEVFGHGNNVVSTLKEMNDGMRQNIDVIDAKVTKIDSQFVYYGDEKLEYNKLMIATGSSPRLLPNIPEDKLITNENFLELTELPKKLAIIGGGYIGCEFANIFANLGSNVEIFEMGEQILLTEDKDVLKDVVKSFEDRGVQIHLNTPFNDSGFDKIFVAIGRVPNIEFLGDFIEINRGIKVDSRMKTSNENIYAIGDCASAPYRLAHVSSYEAKIAARNIAIDLAKVSEEDLLKSNLELSMDYSAIPTRVFVDPLITGFGKHEKDLEEGSYVVGRSWFKSNGMPYCSGDLRGFVKVLVDKKTHCIVGASALGTVDLHSLGLAIKEKITIEKYCNLIHFHPGNQEIVLNAAKAALKQI